MRQKDPFVAQNVLGNVQPYITSTVSVLTRHTAGKTKRF
jgi:hypothetical protein